MNLLQARIVLRPRGALESFDLGVLLQQELAGPVLRLSAVVLLPVAVAGVAAALADLAEVALAVIVVLTPVLQAPFTRLGARALFGWDQRVGPVLGDLGRRWWAMLGLLLLVPLLLVVSTFSLMLMAVPVLVMALYVPEALLLEDVGLVRAWGRAASLAGAASGRVTLSTALVGLLPVWGALVAEGLGQSTVQWVLSLPAGLSVMDGRVSPFVIVGWLAALPLTSLVRLVGYVDARTWTEGWDLQVALMAARSDP